MDRDWLASQLATMEALFTDYLASLSTWPQQPLSQQQLIVFIVAALVIIAGLIVVICLVIRVLHQIRAAIRRARIAEMDRLYPGISNYIDNRYTINKCKKDHRDNNWFDIEFPVWEASNRNGSRDRRRPYNGLCWGVCRLFLGEFCITCVNPCDMVFLVGHLRSRGANIPMNQLEYD